MGTSGMKREGREHLPKVEGQIAPTGFERSAYTVEGTVDRMGAFARGLNAQKRWRTPTRLVVIAFLVLMFVVSLTPLLLRIL